ncbi:MAG: YfbU family protein [Candidatus Cryosericum sp.]
MEITKVERQILINQYRILQFLDRQNKDGWEIDIIILKNGYEDQYEDVILQLDDPLPAGSSQLVRDVLDMYSSIELYKAENPDDTEVAGHYASSFAGFSGNEEGEYLGFTRFLLVMMRRFKEVAKANRTENYNSHDAMLPKYRNMLSVWHSFKHESAQLMKEQVMQLLETPDR